MKKDEKPFYCIWNPIKPTHVLYIFNQNRLFLTHSHKALQLHVTTLPNTHAHTSFCLNFFQQTQILPFYRVCTMINDTNARLLCIYSNGNVLIKYSTQTPSFYGFLNRGTQLPFVFVQTHTTSMHRQLLRIFTILFFIGPRTYRSSLYAYKFPILPKFLLFLRVLTFLAIHTHSNKTLLLLAIHFVLYISTHHMPPTSLPLHPLLTSLFYMLQPVLYHTASNIALHVCMHIYMRMSWHVTVEGQETSRVWTKNNCICTEFLTRFISIFVCCFFGSFSVYEKTVQFEFCVSMSKILYIFKMYFQKVLRIVDDQKIMYSYRLHVKKYKH